MSIKVVVIGASFAKAAYLPALATIPDAEVVAIASARLESAKATAAAFHIPHAYDQWEIMLDKHPADLVCVVTPPVYHAAMTLAGLETGAHVICEKPMAMNSHESRQMLERATALNRLHIMGHELRFNPNRRKIKQIIDSGAIGQVRHVNVINITSGAGDPASRPANYWWMMADMGGGVVGANGSHQIDLLRFWLGDISAVSGQVATIVPQRKDKDTGQPWTATGDDQFSFTATTKMGALASVFVSTAARHMHGNTVEIFGSEGSLRLSNDDEKLWLAQAGEDFQDISETDPNATLPGIGKGIWNVSFVALMQELLAAIRDKRPLRAGATFEDGLKCQQVMDAVKQSSAERRWITLN